MIIHRYKDGSEGYQYEIGDRVVVERTVHGGWFDIGPTKSDECRIALIKKGNWRIAFLEVRFSTDWGTATCAPRHLKPHEDALKSATVADA